MVDVLLLATVFTLPFGVALQNLLSSILLIVLSFRFFSRANRSHSFQVFSHYRWVFGIALCFVLMNIFSSVMNPANSAGIEKFLAGHLVWLSFPVIIGARLSIVDTDQFEKMASYSKVGFAGLAVIVALVALSQQVWGWKLEGGFPVDGPYRSHGFYSHPLTLAYVALVGLPLAVGVFLKSDDNRKVQRYLLLASVVSIIFLTESRVVIFLMLGYIFYLLVLNRHLRSRLMRVIFIFLLAGGVTYSVSPSFKKRATDGVAAKFENSSGYPADRVAFWHAHLLMIGDRPFLGHGVELDTDYRESFYERIGLGQFKKKYAAHNVYIQVAANSGLLGLGLFLVWALLNLSFAFRIQNRAFLHSIVLFLVGGLTQNAFQDSEVRFALVLMLSGMWTITFRDRLAHDNLNQIEI